MAVIARSRGHARRGRTGCPARGAETARPGCARASSPACSASESAPIVAHAWQIRSGEVRFRGRAARHPRDASSRSRSSGCGSCSASTTTCAEFFAEFKRDPVLGPALRRRPWMRPRRRPWPWEALAGAIAGQLIEASRAAAIERRMVRRWGREVRGARRRFGSGWLRDAAERRRSIAGRAPAELAGMDLSGGAVDRDDPLRPRGRRRAASTSTAPATTSASRASARSAPGPCSASASTAAATPTPCPRATSPTSSSSAAWPASAAAPPSPEVEEYFERLRPVPRPRRRSFAATHYHCGQGPRRGRPAAPGRVAAPPQACRRTPTPSRGSTKTAPDRPATPRRSEAIADSVRSSSSTHGSGGVRRGP